MLLRKAMGRLAEPYPSVGGIADIIVDLFCQRDELSKEHIDRDVRCKFHGSQPITIRRSTNFYRRMDFYRRRVDCNRCYVAGNFIQFQGTS